MGPSIGELFQVMYTVLVAESPQCVQLAEDEPGDDSTHVEFRKLVELHPVNEANEVIIPVCTRGIMLHCSSSR
jgi:hypothetical protein